MGPLDGGLQALAGLLLPLLADLHHVPLAAVRPASLSSMVDAREDPDAKSLII